ncbi:hypothetical protein P7K49_024609 [Saguinus oedipus]|uniref:Peptidyl-prolyl cis-trans isomerase n=1 Tax=Saguinus oedipus TaxID=9490 RepID=A0ABQ9URM8_SAGOE|nr:hypothetical protein P7K49_024609 [Saguinus oedipus]
MFNIAVDSQLLGHISFELFADKILALCPWQTLDPTQMVPFFMCTVKTEWLDGEHVVFGEVKGGMNIMEAMERFGSRNDKTSKKITNDDRGQL